MAQLYWGTTFPGNEANAMGIYALACLEHSWALAVFASFEMPEKSCSQGGFSKFIRGWP